MNVKISDVSMIDSTWFNDRFDGVHSNALGFCRAPRGPLGFWSMLRSSRFTKLGHPFRGPAMGEEDAGTQKYAEIFITVSPTVSYLSKFLRVWCQVPPGPCPRDILNNKLVFDWLRKWASCFLGKSCRHRLLEAIAICKDPFWHWHLGALGIDLYRKPLLPF